MPFYRWIADGLKRLGKRRRQAAVRRSEARALRQQVEEAVSATEPRIRLVNGYREQLRPVVQHALEYCRELVDQIPGPFDIRPESWGSDPLVTAYFATAGEVKTAVAACRELRGYFSARPDAEAFALLTMAPEEKPFFGTAASGELLQRDVRKISLNFSRHRFTSPDAGLPELKDALRQRAMRFLLTCALEKIAALKDKEARLDHEHEILDVQWRLQQSRELGLDSIVGHAAGPPKTEAGSRIVAEIHEKLEQVRAKLDEPADYLAHVSQVLENPGLFLRVEPASPRLDPMGIRVKETDPDPGHLVPYGEIALGPEKRTLAAVICRVFRADVTGKKGRSQR